MSTSKVEMKRSRRGVTIAENDNPDDSAATIPLLLRIACLEKDLERRQESYVTRERDYKTRIQEQDLLLVSKTKTDWMKSDGKMSKLKSLQGQIIKNVDLVQDQTSRVLQDQERDLLRSFRARLFDVQTELEKEKSKKDDGAGVWIARSRKLESEVDWAKEVADRLERINQSLLADNSRLKSQFNGQEEDRNFLIAQLVHVKKENSQLKAEVASLRPDDEILQSKAKKSSEETKIGGISGSSTIILGAGSSGRQGSQRDGIGGNSNNFSADSTTPVKYKDINIRLRRLLAEERRALQSVRTSYAAELRSRTDMEMLFRQCVDDVKKEISRRTMPHPGCYSGGRPTFCGSPNSIAEITSTASFSLSDRERTLELLLSQEKDFSRGVGHEGGVGVDTDVLLAISMGPFDSPSVTQSGACDDDDCEGLPVSEGGGGPLIAAALLSDTAYQLSGPDSSRLPAI